MRRLDRQPAFLSGTLCLIFSALWAILPGKLHAATINVGPDQTHKTIQSALNDAVTGDTIFVEIGIYAEKLTIPAGVDNLILEGEETARTVIDGGGTGTVIDLADFSNHITILKFTIRNGTAGISIGSTGTAGSIDITNNVIIDHSTGIRCTSSANINITNNVIDGNGTGVSCSTPNNVKIRNNIISNNQTGASFTGTNTGSSGTYNNFFNNTSDGSIPTTNDVQGDPLFVDPTNNDYHLETNSACLDKGDPDPSFNDIGVSTTPVDHTRNDCGAYGGPNMDVTPFQVSNLKAVGCTSPPDCTTINLTWNENQAYNIGDYEVFSGESSGSYPLTVTTGTNICNTSHVCSYTLDVASFAPFAPLPPPPSAPGQLILDQPVFGDSLLKFHWSWAAGVTLPDNLAGYFVNYDTVSGPPYGSTIDVGNTTSYTLTGLTNGIVYHIAITAYSAPLFYIAVKAKDDSPTSHTSDFSAEATAFLPDPKTESIGQSNEVSEFPEALAPFPDLPDQGRCFIATAAYGSPWEPQVKLLRAFRDEYLERYNLGRRFIAWYYHTSPPWAQYLNEHAWLKPTVRVALMPVVGLAYFFVAATGIGRFLILLLLILCWIGGMFVMAELRRSRG